MSKQDDREFNALCLPLYDNLYGAAMRLTRDPADAEDLVQDALLRAYRFWDTFQRGTNIKAWLFTILRNTFINGYHRRNRDRDFMTAHAHVDTFGDDSPVGFASNVGSPREALARAETASRVREAVERLPADYRDAVTLCDLAGLSYKEVAEIMECPIGTVMSRIYRGRQLLRRSLARDAEEMGIRTSAPEVTVAA